MSFLDRFRSKKDDDASRISRLLTTGRMVDGSIVDVVTDDNARIIEVTYSYIVAGVRYESSQQLNTEQQLHSDRYGPGRQVVVRYDRLRPANSVVV